MGILEDAKYKEMGKQAEKAAAHKQSYLAGISDAEKAQLEKMMAQQELMRQALSQPMDSGLAQTSLPALPDAATLAKMQAANDSTAAYAAQAQGLAGAQ